MGIVVWCCCSCGCSVSLLCPTLCDTMDCSTPGFPILHHFPEIAQTHVRWLGDGHPTISSSVLPFSSCLQSFPASGSFPVSQFFPSGGQSIGTLASASVFLINIQGWFPLGLTGLLSLQSQESSPTPQFKSIHSLALSFLYGPTCTSTGDYWKNHSFDYAGLW